MTNECETNYEKLTSFTIFKEYFMNGEFMEFKCTDMTDDRKFVTLTFVDDEELVSGNFSKSEIEAMISKLKCVAERMTYIG